jgi:hypothetical protein
MPKHEVIYLDSDSDSDEMTFSQTTLPPTSQPPSEFDDVLELTDEDDEPQTTYTNISDTFTNNMARYSPLPPSSPPNEAIDLSDVDFDDDYDLTLPQATTSQSSRQGSSYSGSHLLDLLDADDEEVFPPAASLLHHRSSPPKRGRTQTDDESDEDMANSSPPKKPRASTVRDIS